MREQADWKDLVGQQVRVMKGGRTIRIGYVRDITVAAEALWVEADGVESRALYEKAEGYTVLPVSEPAK